MLRSFIQLLKRHQLVSRAVGVIAALIALATFLASVSQIIGSPLLSFGAAKSAYSPTITVDTSLPGTLSPPISSPSAPPPTPPVSSSPSTSPPPGSSSKPLATATPTVQPPIIATVTPTPVPNLISTITGHNATYIYSLDVADEGVSEEGPWHDFSTIPNSLLPYCGFHDGYFYDQPVPNGAWYCFGDTTNPQYEYVNTYIQIDMTFRGGTKGMLACRVHSGAGYLLYLSNTGDYTLNNGYGTTLLQGNLPNISRQKATLGILALNNTISITIDQQAVDQTVQDSNSTSGGVGVYAKTGNIVYDNLRIWNLNADGTVMG